MISVEFNLFEGGYYYFIGLGLIGNYLSKYFKCNILVCVADDIFFILYLCLCLFVIFFISFRLVLLFWSGVYFIMNAAVYFIDCNIVTLNGKSVITIFLFD